MTDHKASIHGSAENAARMRANLGLPEPMTNDEREALIEKAARAIRGSHLSDAWEELRGREREFRREQARAALAVFEQAHTPTEHECTWACWVDRYGQDHHTPTDDEREALEDQLRKEFEYRIRTAVAYGAMKNYREIPSQVRADWIQGEISKAMSVARTRVLDGFRRPVQGEPLPDYFAPKPMPQGWVWAEPQEVDADPDTAFELGRVAGYDEAMREVQAEPTEAQLIDLYWKTSGDDWAIPEWLMVAFGRAALRAAFQEGETR